MNYEVLGDQRAVEVVGLEGKDVAVVFSWGVAM